MKTDNAGQPYRQPYSLIIVAAAINAALYAVSSYATSYIPSPWGVGQFLPAVVIPALFATIFGPWAGGIGAALGTLIADSAKHGGLYFGSLLAAVPGNFIGFFIFGYVLRKKFNWARFVTVTNVTLVIANAIVAFLYVFIFKLYYSQVPAFTQLASDALIVLSVGLTLFWFVTMLPFVLLTVPPLIAVVASAFPSIIPGDLQTNAAKNPPKRLLALSMLIPGVNDNYWIGHHLHGVRQLLVNKFCDELFSSSHYDNASTFVLHQWHNPHDYRRYSLSDQ
jgi:uncharacterized membrane protein